MKREDKDLDRRLIDSLPRSRKSVAYIRRASLPVSDKPSGPNRSARVLPRARPFCISDTRGFRRPSKLGTAKSTSPGNYRLWLPSTPWSAWYCFGTRGGGQAGVGVSIRSGSAQVGSAEKLGSLRQMIREIEFPKLELSPF
jgi:hypothetical protein